MGFVQDFVPESIQIEVMVGVMLLIVARARAVPFFINALHQSAPVCCKSAASRGPGGSR